MLQDLFSPTNFDFFARYFLAGFILFSVRGRYVLGERPKPAEVVFEAIVLSLINQLVFLLLVGLVQWIAQLCGWNTGAIVDTNGKTALFLEVLILPTLLGAVFGANLKRGWNSAFLRRLSMPVVHPTRRAYDFAFSDRETCFLIVNFKDGGSVYGYFGPTSLAASDPGRSDLYLETLYDVANDGQWTESNPPRSALISIDDVRSIEFVPTPTEVQHDTHAPD